MAKVSVPSRCSRAIAYRVWVSSRQLGPARRRVHVDLDHPGVGRDHQRLDPRVRRRAVALEDHRRAGLGRGALDQPDQLDELLQLLQRRQEDVHEAVPGLHHQRRPRRRLLGVDHDRARPMTGRIERRSGPGVALLAGEVRVGPGDRAERQPHAGREVAGDQHEPAAPGPPGRAGPALAEPRRQQRQRPGDRLRLDPGPARRPVPGRRPRGRAPAAARPAAAPPRPARPAGPRSRPGAVRRAGRSRR